MLMVASCCLQYCLKWRLDVIGDQSLGTMKNACDGTFVKLRECNQSP